MAHAPSVMRYGQRLAALLLCLGDLTLWSAGPPLPPELEGVEVREHLSKPVDLSLTFVAENGRTVALRESFREGKPVLLTLAYYRCPMLCNLVLNGQVAALRELAWTPGNQFNVITVSIDPAETFNLAREKRLLYLESYGRPAPGWRFLSDADGNARRLADQVGFHYRYDRRQQQFAHPAVIIVLTPDGKVARYLYGIRYRARDLRLALTEASAYRWGNSIEKLLLFCYHYDPSARAYVLFARSVMRAGGVLIVLVLSVSLLRLFWAERRRLPTGAG